MLKFDKGFSPFSVTLCERIFREHDPTYIIEENATHVTYELEILFEKDPEWIKFLEERGNSRNFQGLTAHEALMIFQLNRHACVNRWTGPSGEFLQGPPPPIVSEFLTSLLKIPGYQPFQPEEIKSFLLDGEFLNSLFWYFNTSDRFSEERSTAGERFTKKDFGCWALYVSDQEFFEPCFSWCMDDPHPSPINFIKMAKGILSPEVFEERFQRFKEIWGNPWHNTIRSLYRGGNEVNWITEPIHPLEEVLMNIANYTPRELLYMTGSIIPLMSFDPKDPFPLRFHLSDEMAEIFTRSSGSSFTLTDFELIFKNKVWIPNLDSLRSESPFKRQWFLPIENPWTNSLKEVAFGTLENYGLYSWDDLPRYTLLFQTFNPTLTKKGRNMGVSSWKKNLELLGESDQKELKSLVKDIFHAGLYKKGWEGPFLPIPHFEVMRFGPWSDSRAIDLLKGAIEKAGRLSPKAKAVYEHIPVYILYFRKIYNENTGECARRSISKRIWFKKWLRVMEDDYPIVESPEIISDPYGELLCDLVKRLASSSECLRAGSRRLTITGLISFPDIHPNKYENNCRNNGQFLSDMTGVV